MLDLTMLGTVVARINASVSASAQALADFLPHLAEDELLVRLRLLASAADTLRARLEGTGLYALPTIGWDRHEQMLHKQLIEMSLGALKTS